MGRWIKGAAAVTLAALSVACGSAGDQISPADAPIVARIDCDAELEAPCKRAAELWNPALVGTRWRWVTSGEATLSVRVRAVEGNARDCFGDDAWNGCSRGWTEGVEINVAMSRGWRDVEKGRAAIVAHELGHLMGIPHQESGLMSTKRLYDQDCIDSVTAEAIGGVATCAP